MNAFFPDGIGAIERRIAQLDPDARPAATDAATFAAYLPATDAGRVLGTTQAPAPAEIERTIQTSAQRYGVDPSLVRAIVAQESGFDPYATSAAGAQGLMQLMPETAAELGVTDPYDAVQNVDGGVRYLRTLLDRFGGDVRRAVAAYNAGPGAVERYDGVPPYAETQAYVVSVLGGLSRAGG